MGGTSAASTLLAYMRGSASDASARLVWLDQTGKTSAAPSQVGTSERAISPDGRFIAFASGGIDTSDIKVWDTTREMLVSVTNDGHGHSLPVWAPNSKHLAFRSLISDGYALSWARPEGGGQIRTLLEASFR